MSIFARPWSGGDRSASLSAQPSRSRSFRVGRAESRQRLAVHRLRRAPSRLTYVFVLTLTAGALGAGEVHAQAIEAPGRSFGDLALDAYAEQYRVTPEEASRRLALQDRGANIVAVLRRRMGGGYAGVWFDHQEAEFRIGVARTADSEAARAAAAELRLGDDYELVPVERTLAELESALAQTNARLKGHLAEREASTGIDMAANAVAVEFSQRMTAEERDHVQQVARDEASVVAEAVPTTRFDTRFHVCAFPNCSRPLRGGVKINHVASGRSCTAGFMAYDPWATSDTKFVLTAGHCFYFFPGLWRAYRTTVGWENIGYSHDNIYLGEADSGMIPVTGAWQGTFNPWVVYWDPEGGVYNEAWTVHDRAWPYQWQFVCKWGMNTAGTCGTVLRTDVTQSFGGFGQVHHLAETNACTDEGDSGGPWMTWNWAYGTTTGGNGCYAPTYEHNQRNYFTEVIRSELVTGLRLITEVTGPK